MRAFPNTLGQDTSSDLARQDLVALKRCCQLRDDQTRSCETIVRVQHGVARRLALYGNTESMAFIQRMGFVRGRTPTDEAYLPETRELMILHLWLSRFSHPRSSADFMASDGLEVLTYMACLRSRRASTAMQTFRKDDRQVPASDCRYTVQKVDWRCDRIEQEVMYCELHGYDSRERSSVLSITDSTSTRLCTVRRP